MNKVLAIVVTYNRLECLKECMSALKKQTCNNFDILVVNNGSTDGTEEYLSEVLGITNINQPNLGGAGGFYTGMKYGYERGYDWLWLMDDDGLPQNNQLEELLKHVKFSEYLNALVVDKEDESKFAFPPQDVNFTINVAKKKEIIQYFVHPFNGTFFHRTLIDKIGLIKKEMFIWGDEKEYTNRAVRAGVIPTTVTTAIHHHPKEKATKFYPIPFWRNPKTEVLLKPLSMSHYYYRNLGYIDATYRTIPKSIKLILVHLLFFIRTANFSELAKFVKFYFKGRHNNYK